MMSSSMYIIYVIAVVNATSFSNTDVQLDENVDVKQRVHTWNGPTTAKRYGNGNVDQLGSQRYQNRTVDSLRSQRYGNKTVDLLGSQNSGSVNLQDSSPVKHTNASGTTRIVHTNTYGSLIVSVDIGSAVKKGFRAQVEYCNIYCNGSRRISKRNGCYTTNAVCSRCYCDKGCKYYRDCCPSLRDKDVPDIVRDDFYQCSEIMLGFQRSFVPTIHGCPEASTNETRQAENCSQCGKRNRSIENSVYSTDDIKHSLNCSLCGHGSSLAVSLDSQAVYCSTGCGQCNGDTDLVNLPQTTCIDTGETVHVINYEDNWGQVIFPARQCIEDARRVAKQRIDTCNDSVTSDHAHGDEMAVLCQLYSFPVDVGGVSYRNMFCALCNGERLLTATCGGPSGTFPPTVTLKELGRSDVSIVTSLKPLYTYETVGSTGCLDNQWYDSVMDVCRNVTCLNGRTRIPGQLYCEDPSVADSSFLLYTLRSAFKVTTNATYVPCLRDWNLVRGAIIPHLAKTVLELNATAYALQVDNFYSFSGEFDTFVEFITRKSENQTEFELNINEHFNRSQLFLEIPGNGEIEFRAYIYTSWYHSSGQSFVSFPNGSCCFEAGYRVSLESAYYQDNHSNVSRENLSSIDGFNLLMPYAIVILNDSEYAHVGDRFILENTNVTLSYLDTDYGADLLRVPIVYLQKAYEAARLSPKPLQRVKVAQRSDPVQQILSLCCLVLSISSLIFLLATYCTFSQLRSLPGLNNMCLAAWLLLAQLLLLVVPDLTELSVCHVLGMALHYAWLCVISWCCVCSVHMFHVFVTQRDQMHAPHSNIWYIKRYATLAHVVPAFVVGLVVGCTMFVTEGQETGYGGHVCYLNAVILRGVAFVLPLALAVTLNVVLLVLTGCALSGTQREQNLGRRSEPSYIRIYAKLSSLTGFCWFFAILAELPGCGWMLYLSTVLNGLQGFHLAVSYAGNKRVLNLWHVKVFGKGKEQKIRSSESTDRSAARLTESTLCSSV